MHAQFCGFRLFILSINIRCGVCALITCSLSTNFCITEWVYDRECERNTQDFVDVNMCVGGKFPTPIHRQIPY